MLQLDRTQYNDVVVVLPLHFQQYLSHRLPWYLIPSPSTNTGKAGASGRGSVQAQHCRVVVKQQPVGVLCEQAVEFISYRPNDMASTDSCGREAALAKDLFAHLLYLLDKV